MQPSKAFLIPVSTVFSSLVTTLSTLLKKKIKLIRLNLFLTSLCFLFSHDYHVGVDAAAVQGGKQGAGNATALPRLHTGSLLLLSKSTPIMSICKCVE